MVDRDVVLEVTGQFGKWQLRTLLIIFLCKIPTSWFMAIIIYTAPPPRPGEMVCKTHSHFAASNRSTWISILHPTRHNDIDLCNVYKDVYDSTIYHPNRSLAELEQFTGLPNRTIIPCTDFDFAAEFHSMVVEYSLVCGRSLLVQLSQCFHIFGLLIGGIVAYFMIKK